jgi:endonuclease G
VLKQAETERYCVLAGPILEKDDPVFVGKDDVGAVQIPIPRRFWKIVVARSGDELQTFAFLLDQDLSDTHFEGVEFAIDADWRRRMISVAQLDKLIPQITFPAELRHSDQIDAEPGEAVRAAAGGMETVAAPA